MKTYVIAEAGSCHDGDLGKAMRLVDEAAQAGASAVKFQFWSDAHRLADRRKAGDYLNIYERYQMPKKWLAILADHADLRDIEFMCTAYLPEDIDTVAPYVSKFKVASFECLDTNFILDHLRWNKDIIVSTGMTDRWELHRLLGLHDLIPEIKVLHCVSSYPAPLESLNLSVIREYGLDGFSDHTGREQMGAWAVMAGAMILEVHFRLVDTDRANPDAPHALNPSGLYWYVQAVQDAEKAYGERVKSQQPAEAAMAKYRVV